MQDGVPAEPDTVDGSQSPRAAPPSPRLKCLYGIGEIALAVKQQCVGLFTLYLYTTLLGLSGTIVGLVSAAGLLWDAMIDPYIGYLSDRSRSRLGRRHVFMLAGALTMGASFWAYFAPPRGLSPGLLVLWFLASNLFLRTTTSFFGVPYYALGAELSQDYHERSSVTGIRGIFSLAGTLATVAISYLVFFPNAQDGVDPKLAYEGYLGLGLVFGFVMTVTGLIATFGSRDAGAFPAPGRTRTSTEEVRRFFSGLRLSLENPAFLALFCSYAFFFLGVVVNALLANHYFTYYVRILDSRILTAFHLTFLVSALLGVPLWLRVSKSVEKRVLCGIATSSLTGLLFCAWMLMGEGHLFGTGNALPLILGNGLAGFFSSILWFMPTSMIADVTDLDTCTTGERREGSYFGMFFFGQQIATGLALLLVGVLVDAYAGLVPAQALQSPTTANRIGILFGILPATCLLFATIAVFFYSVNRERVLAVQSEIGKGTWNWKDPTS